MIIQQVYNLQIYLRYSYLWAQDKNEHIRNFIQSKPFMYEIEDKFVTYEELLDEIDGLPEYHIVGSLRINMGIYLK